MPPAKWRIHKTKNNSKGCEPGKWKKRFGWERVCFNSHHLFKNPTRKIGRCAVRDASGCWSPVLMRQLSSVIRRPCCNPAGLPLCAVSLIHGSPKHKRRDPQLLARVAHNMNSGLTLLLPSEAREEEAFMGVFTLNEMGRKLLRQVSSRFYKLMCFTFLCMLHFLCCSVPFFYNTCPKADSNIIVLFLLIIIIIIT